MANKIIVGNIGWAENIPKWLMEEIKSERIVNGLISIGTEKENPVGDAEIVAYLFTANLGRPLDRSLGEIYVYLTSKLMKKKKIDLPDEFKKKLSTGLSKNEEEELQRLRTKLCRARGKIEHPLFDVLKALKKTAKKC